MDYYHSFIGGLKLIPRYLFSFIKKMYLIIFFYGLPMTIPILVALSILWVLSSIPGIDPQIAQLVFKIIVTVGQIIPLSIYLYIADNELNKTDEDAPELCIACCAAVITWIWVCI